MEIYTGVALRRGQGLRTELLAPRAFKGQEEKDEPAEG